MNRWCLIAHRPMPQGRRHECVCVDAKVLVTCQEQGQLMADIWVGYTTMLEVCIVETSRRQLVLFWHAEKGDLVPIWQLYMAFLFQ
jgi:hypothetical protein